MSREAPMIVVARSATLPPQGGPPVEIGEQSTFGKVLPPLPHFSSHAVQEGRVVSFPIPPLRGPACARHRLLYAGAAAPGGMGSANNLFDDSQVPFDAPPIIGAHLVDAFRQQSHPPVPPSGNALIPSVDRLLRYGRQCWHRTAERVSLRRSIARSWRPDRRQRSRMATRTDQRSAQPPSGSSPASNKRGTGLP